MKYWYLITKRSCADRYRCKLQLDCLQKACNCEAITMINITANSLLSDWVFCCYGFKHLDRYLVAAVWCRFSQSLTVGYYSRGIHVGALSRLSPDPSSVCSLSLGNFSACQLANGNSLQPCLNFEIKWKIGHKAMTKPWEITWES